LGVRWVILVDGAAPTLTGAPAMPLPAAVRDPFARQLDLRRIEVDPALDLYENLAWETG
ncbi:MAG: hypothetical protein H0U26_01495, partial [Acidimicrobiia bacterium]|nr:hypothetical protein [Acidimicrobiia bacterium]